jgi:SAM-dependent methyltransferase
VDQDSPDLLALRNKLEAEERAYAALLDAMDAIASFPVPLESLPDLARQKDRLNELWNAAPAPEGGGLGGRGRRSVWAAMAPALERQQDFNATLVQLLNGYLDESALLHARLREVITTLVRYLQRVLPVMDAKDRMASALATTRAELILEAFDRRQESLGRRVEGLLALRDRVELLSEELRALRAGLSSETPSPPAAAAATRAADDSTYVAFENRFRGSREEIRRHLATYLPLFEGLAPIVDLGCGRGEFLDLLKEQGIPARGVEGNSAVARECRERGLDVVDGDLLAFLRAEKEGELGGVFAAQVAEHLPPAVLQATLREAHRVLRPGGLLVLETVNPRSVHALLESYNRDLSHERPLHPDTLRFLAAACGFSDVRVEMKSPVEASTLLRAVPMEGLPQRAADVLNENIRRLNALLYGDQDYALLARR